MKTKILRALFIIIGFSVMAYTTLVVFAADQMKTTETRIADSNVAVSTDQTYPFTFYIGDNLQGITNPVKSLHFITSGVYTGTGTITFMINSDVATTKTLTLPNVGSPTPFEIVYKDPSNKINPSSGGSYSYSLNFNPSGVTVYSLGIKMTETHQYVPPTCLDGSSSNEKMKTTESLVADSKATVSTDQTYPFTFYIGDNLQGITNPVKSLHFITSGVYTGTGTITFMINSDVATTKTLTLPNVGSPTPFEIDYKDPSNKINPNSGGSYNYSLNFNPSGVTIYSLGIKMKETHRYVPPTCEGMPVLGELTSAVFDSTSSGSSAGYNSIMWKGALGGAGFNEGTVRFQLAASASSSGPWNYYGGATCSSSDYFDTTGPNSPVELKGATCLAAWNNKRYFRYKIQICSNDCVSAGTNTPTIDDVIVNWSP